MPGIPPDGPVRLDAKMLLAVHPATQLPSSHT